MDKPTKNRGCKPRKYVVEMDKIFKIKTRETLDFTGFVGVARERLEHLITPLKR